MYCPDCGGKTVTKDSRPRDNGTYRRLSCISCGKRFSTIEIPIDVLDQLTNTEQQVKLRINDILKTMAERAIIKGQVMSTVTGGMYEDVNVAIVDTLKELKQLTGEYDNEN